MHHTQGLLIRGALATSLSLPKEILHAAGQMASAKKLRLNQTAPKKRAFSLVSEKDKIVTMASGIQIAADIQVQQVTDPDLLLLPALWRNPVSHVKQNTWVVDMLKNKVSSNTIICSVGTSSFFLAKAGLLDGKPASTHWRYMDLFAKMYPTVKLKREHLITQTGNIYCVGSVNSIADVMIYIVEQWYGEDIAIAVANQFSPEIRQPFKKYAYQQELQSSHHDELVTELQMWFQQQFQNPSNIDAWSQTLGISVRSLQRRFKHATGVSPTAYLHQVRMTAAQELLRQSNLSVSEIAWQVGIEDVSYFGLKFKQQFSVSAQAYRKMMKPKLFAVS